MICYVAYKQSITSYNKRQTTNKRGGGEYSINKVRRLFLLVYKHHKTVVSVLLACFLL